MTNWEVDEAVYEALGRTLETNVNRDLHPVLRLAVNRAVHVAVYRAVDDAVYRARYEDPPHPGLKLDLAAVS